MSTLYIVATPIGNLEDITLRALRILKEVDMIVCEDTRVTKKLLTHYEIMTPCLSLHARSNDAQFDRVLRLLEDDKTLAYVSDAGTPGVSDPGTRLVALVREQFGDTVTVAAIPGASALTAALSIAGVPASEFVFLGFLPHKKGRQTLLKEIAESKRTVIFYESVHRIKKALGELEKVLEPSQKVVFARELTKHFEEVQSGTPRELLNLLETTPEKEKGEFVVLVSKS